MSKNDIIEMIKEMPDNSSIDDIMAELYFRTQVDEGLKQLDSGKSIPHEQVKKRISKWIK